MSNTPGAFARYAAGNLCGRTPAELEKEAFRRASEFFGVPADRLEVAEPYVTEDRGGDSVYATILVCLDRS